MTNCTVSGNTATIGSASQGFSSSGGGIATTGNYTLTNCQVTNNTAYQGGGLRTNGGTGTISGSTFSGNSATSGTYTGSDDDGGAIYLVSGTLTLNSSTNVTGNTADGDGGAIYVADGALTVTGGKIGWRDTGTNNTAVGNGGGIYQAGGTVALNSTVLVYGNTAANGAGLYVAGWHAHRDGREHRQHRVGRRQRRLGQRRRRVRRQRAARCRCQTTGASIGGNRAAQGAGVYINGGTMTTTAGHVSNNTATTAGRLDLRRERLGDPRLHLDCIQLRAQRGRPLCRDRHGDRDRRHDFVQHRLHLRRRPLCGLRYSHPECHHECTRQRSRDRRGVAVAGGTLTATGTTFGGTDSGQARRPSMAAHLDR